MVRGTWYVVQVLHATADQLALHGAHLERAAEVERAELAASNEAEQAKLRTELDSTLTLLRRAQEVCV